MAKDPYCCERFRNFVNAADPDSIRIVPVLLDDGCSFFALQFNAVPSNMIKSLPRNLEGMRIVLQARQAIQFCPWCGVTLDRHYSKRINELPYMPEEAFFSQCPSVQDR